MFDDVDFTSIINIKAANIHIFIDFTKIIFHKSQKQIKHTDVIVLAAATTTTHDTNDDDGDDNQDQQRSAASDCAVKNGFTNKQKVNAILI